LAFRGLLKGRDSIDHRPLIEAVRERWLPVIEASPELKLRFSSDPDFKWVIDLLRSRSRGRHPLKQSLVIGTLAPSVAAFANPPDRPPAPQPAPKPVAVPDWGDQLKELVINQGLSVSAAASKLGISVNTALVHAYRAGLPIVRRPKRLTPSDRREIAGRLAMNEPVRFIAHDVGLSESTINRILMEDRRIAAERDVASESARRDKARSALTDAVRQAPRPTFSAIRSTTGPDFAWLYRRDKTWLTEQLESARDTAAGEQRG
jgi:plasmid maintenance system antidote protein VapI